MPSHVRPASFALLLSLLSRAWSLEVAVARHRPEAAPTEAILSDDELGSFFSTDEAPRSSSWTTDADSVSASAAASPAAQKAASTSASSSPSSRAFSSSSLDASTSSWSSRAASVSASAPAVSPALLAAQVSTRAGNVKTGAKDSDVMEESEADKFLESDSEDEIHYGQDDEIDSRFETFDLSGSGSETGSDNGKGKAGGSVAEEEGEELLDAEGLDFDFDLSSEAQGVAGMLATEAKRKAQDAALDREARGEAMLNDTATVALDANAPKEVKTVLKALRGVKKEMRQEGTAEAQNYKKVKVWCRKEERTQKRTKNAANATKILNMDNARDQRAEISILEHRLKVVAKTLQEVNDVIEQATAVRKAEAAKFENDLTTNKQSIVDVGKARKILSSPAATDTSFVQTVLKGKLNANIRGANRLPSKYILGMLGGLKLDLEKAQRELIAEESDKQDKHKKLMATKTKSRDMLEEEQSDKTDKLTAAKVRLLEFEKVIKIATEQEDKATKMLKEALAHCDKAAADYEDASKTRKEEIAALTQAMDIIRAGNSQYEFLAVHNSTSTSAEAEGEVTQAQDDFSLGEEVKDELAGMEADTDALAPSFLEVSSAAASKTKVEAGRDEAEGSGDKGYAADKVVQTLIEQLQATQVQEETKKKYCEKAIEAKTTAKTDLDVKLQEAKTNIGYRKSVAKAAATEVRKFNAKIRSSKKSIRGAARIRKKAQEIFMKGSKNRLLAMKILKQAMNHLKIYYSKVSVATETQKVIFDTINSAIDDIKYEEKQAAATEAAQVKQFEKLQLDARDEYDSFMKEITTVKTSAAKNVVLLAEEKEKKDDLVTDRQAVRDQLRSLHKECDRFLKNFDEKTKGRTFQVAQLRDVKDILAGADIAARTG